MNDRSPYRRLDARHIATSLERLEARIRDRFPEAGLARVCHDLVVLARDNTNRAAAIGRRDWWLWLGVALMLALCAYGVARLWDLVDLAKIVDPNKATSADNVYTLVQGLDAFIHIFFVIGGLLFFLVSMEDRLKRRRALGALNELRSIIHVVDMHQLTKEPGVIIGKPTPNSPKRTLTQFELGRYLDYCSEMLSLIAKIGVLYAQALPDPVIVDAVSDLERLTSNLSQKIWSKIALLDNVSDGPDSASGRTAPVRSEAGKTSGEAEKLL